MESFWHDARHAARMLRKRRGFTAIAVLTLGLGIGANTAIFSAVNALLLRPLPLAEAERVVHGSALREGFDPFGVSLLEFQALRDRGRSFSSLGVAGFRYYNLIEGGEPEQIQGAAVTAEYLTTLGVEPALGRSFTAAEDRPNGGDVAVIGHGLWQRRFAGRGNVLGRALLLGDRSYSIIGVMPPGFDLPFTAEVWLPLQIPWQELPTEQAVSHSYDFVARLKPGVSVEQADDDAKSIARQLEREHAQTQRGWSFTTISMRRHLLGDLDGRVHRAIFASMAAVGMVLLICCVNVASLLLAQGVARERELAIRRALGAKGSRMARQLLTESLSLALGGGALGLIIAYWVTPLLGELNPIQTISFSRFLGDVRIDTRVLAFASLVSLATAAIAGLLPALKAATHADLMPFIKRRERPSVGEGAGRRTFVALVVGELALSVMLLLGGGLLVQSFLRLQRIDLGFRTEGLLTMQMSLPASRYPSHSERVAFVDRMLERVRALAGVVSAGTTTNLPLDLGTRDSVYTVEGGRQARPSEAPITAHRLVSGDYLDALGVTLLRGRLLQGGDQRLDALPVVVISEELARQAWPGDDPLGKRLRRGRPDQVDRPWLTVVGVVKDIKEDRFNFRIDRPAWYLPFVQQDINQPVSLVVRVNGDPAAMAATVRGAIEAVDPAQPVARVVTMKDHLADVLATERFSAVLMGLLAALGLALAALGLYGVLAWSVSQRAREIGLRLALGAESGEVAMMILGQGLKMITAGLAIGLAGTVILSRYLAHVLYGVSTTDPLTFSLMITLLITTAAAACLLPAWRATRTDPLEAFRSE